jgi:hypothetical protein
MTFKCEVDAEELRKRLLENYGIGTIAIRNEYLRVAFSSVALEHLEELYESIYKAAEELK